MRPELVSKSAFDARHVALALKLSASMAMVVVKLRAVAPYALMELILPGGSAMAALLWLYRRQRQLRVFATDEILSLV
jgi:hypothetical protein